MRRFFGASGALALALGLGVGVFGAGSAGASSAENNGGNTNNSTTNNPAGTNSHNTINSGNSNGNGNETTRTGSGLTTTTTGTNSGNHNGNNNGNFSSGQSTGSGGSTTTTTQSLPEVATLASTGDGVVVHTNNGATAPGYQGEPLLLHETVETSGQPSRSSVATPATIAWVAGGMSQLYDALPSQYVPGYGFSGPIQTRITIDAVPPASRPVSVASGFLRFWFPADQTRHYRFEAATGTLVASSNGTDFTVGFDPGTRTSGVFVNQDSVNLTPTNLSLKPFTLSSGNQVEVTDNQVRPVTRLGGVASGPSSQPAGSGSSTGLIIGIVIGVLVFAALVVLVLAFLRDRDRSRRARPGPASEQTAVEPTQELTPPNGSVAVDDGPRDVVRAPTQRMGPWSPTHRAPDGGMGCWGAPDVTGPLVATFDSRLELQVIGRQSHWAHVVCANGFTTWVDGRLLVADGSQDG